MSGRVIEVARVAWGATLLLRPELVLNAVDGPTVDRRGTVVTRILGARQVSQGMLSGIGPSPEVLAMGVWVDATHAVCALALAMSDRRRWRSGVVDAAVAAVWAGVGHRDLVGVRAATPDHDRLRDALARRVLAVVPGGRPLLRLADRARTGDLPDPAPSAPAVDTAAPGTAAPDTAAPGTAAPDTAAPDTAAPDTAAPDTAAPDTAPPDTAAPEPAASEPAAAEADTRFVVIRPEGDIADSDLASIYEGEWRERADLDDPSGIDLDGPHGVVRAVPTDRIEQSPDGSLGQVYEVPDSN